MTFVTYTFSNTTPLIIPDAADLTGTNPGAPVTTSIAVSGVSPGSISNVSLELDGFFHTFTNDLRVTLTGAGVSEFALRNDDGSKDLVGDYIFDDSATATFNTAPAGSTIAPGTYQPHDSFAGFSGITSVNGTWTLTAQDFFSGDTGSINNGWTLSITVENFAPVIANPYAVVAAAGAAPVSLGIAAPTDAENDPLTITLTTLPGYGTVQFFDGTTWVDAVGGQTVTAAELASLRYEVPPSGEHGGDKLVYTVDDGVNAPVTGTVAFNVEIPSAGPAGLFFTSFDDTGKPLPDLYSVDASGLPIGPFFNNANGDQAGVDGGFFQYAGTLYFNAFDSSGTEALFSLDSNGVFTEVADDSFGGTPFVALNGISANFTEFAGKLYFRDFGLGEVDANGATQQILLDGVVFPVFDNNHGGFVEFDHSLYFAALTNTLGGGFGMPDLTRLDADGTITAITTRAPGNEALGSDAGIDGGFIVYNNALYFNAYDDGLAGDTLFRLDAGSTTPVVVDPSLSHTPLVSSAFHIYNNDLYFDEAIGGNDTLVKLDSSGTITPLDYSGDPLLFAGEFNGMFDFSGSMFFVAQTSSTGPALFVLDPDGTITDIYDGTAFFASAFDSSIAGGFVQYDGSLYFDAYVDSVGHDALFKLDPNGTLSNVGLGVLSHAGVNGGFKVLGDSLYFTADGPNGYELVKLNADGTFDQSDINPSGDGIQPGVSEALGIYPLTVLHGTGGPDVIAGTSATEIIEGSGAPDVIYPGGGNDIVTGGGGADTFKFVVDGPANVATITDYSFAGGDVIDLSGLLDTFFGPNSNVMDFARVVPVGNNLVVQVDADGALNGTSWTDVAILEGLNSSVTNEVTAFFGGQNHTLVPFVPFQTDLKDLHTTALTGGGWVVTWSQATDDATFGGTYFDVYARVFDANGIQIGGTITVGDPNDGMDDQAAQVTALSNGGFAITWQFCEDSIFTETFNGGGTPSLAGVQPVFTTGFNPVLGQTLALSGGAYAILSAFEPDALVLATVDASGTVTTQFLGDPSALNDLSTLPGTSDVANRATMVKLADGFAVIWNATPGFFSEDSVVVQVFDDSGAPIGSPSPIQVNDNLDGGFLNSSSEIVATGGDTFAVVWESDSFSSSHIFSRFFSFDFGSNSFTATAPLQIDNAVDDAETPHAVALSGGGYVAMWNQSDDNGNSGDIFIQVFDSNGATTGTPVQVNQVADDAANGQQVIALAGGGFAVLFETDRDDGTGFNKDVYIRTFAADGTHTSNEILVSAANGNNQFGQDAFALGDGSFLALWSDVAADGTHDDIYVRHIGANGSLLAPEILVVSTPHGAANEQSFISEFRAAVSDHPALLVGEIDNDTLDSGSNNFDVLATQFLLPPVVATSAGTTNVAALSPTVIDSGVTVSDSDSATLATATIAITAGFQTGEDVLAFTNNDGATFGNITASYDTATGILTLISSDVSATLAQWQAALDAVTYNDTSATTHTGSRTVSFSVSDGVYDSNIATQALDVSAPPNQAPTDISLAPASVAENSANGTVVGALTDTDPNPGDSATFALLDNAGGAFAINGSNLVVADGTKLDFENATSKHVSVQVTDGGGLTFSKDFTIGVTNVNEAPTDIALSHASVAENSANGTVVGALSDTDPDAGDTATFSLLANAGGAFAINGNNLVVADGTKLDFENATSKLVTVKVTDGGGLTFTKDFTIGVTNVNEAPTDIALSHTSVPENSANGTVVGNLSDTDPDAGDTATFTLLANAGGAFAISGSNLVVADGTKLDFESASSQHVTVKVTDGGGLTFTKDFTIGVTNVNEAPTDIALSHARVAGHSANGTVVGALSDTDPDAGDSAAFSLTDNAGGAFAINGNNLVVADGTKLESAFSQHVSVEVTDGGGLTFTKDFTIDVNEGPRPYNWQASGDLNAHPAGYQVAGVGDFNGDGTADVLWRNPTTGLLDEWRMQNDNWSTSVAPGTHTLAEAVAGIGDFNGDGTSDVLWRDPSTGHLDVSLMANGQMANPIDLGSHGADWKVLGVGDFNGDHTSDILFQNTTTGAVDEWVMAGGNWSRTISLGVHNPAYTTAAIGDFDGDGTSDVLWQNPTTGAVEEWHMAAGNWSNTVNLGSHDLAYQLAAVGDFNGDGTSDVFWHNPTTGAVDGWVMHNGQWFSSVSLGAFDPASNLAGTGDFDHSGTADVLWNNPMTNHTSTWLLHAV